MLPKPENFSLTTKDNVELAVSRWRPEGNPVAKVVLAHGFTANRQNQEIQGLAVALLAAGADLTIHDARGHGESSGETTVGNLEQLDIAAVVAHVAGEADQTAASDPPLLLLGVSMGAVASVNYLCSSPGNPVTGLMLISSPAYWRARPGKSAVIMTFLTRTGLGRRVAKRHMGVRIAAEIKLPEAPARAVSRLELPIGIIGGKEDMLLGAKAGQRIYQAAREPKRLALIEEAGHSLGKESLSACEKMFHWLLEAPRHR